MRYPMYASACNDDASGHCTALDAAIAVDKATQNVCYPIIGIRRRHDTPVHQHDGMPPVSAFEALRKHGNSAKDAVELHRQSISDDALAARLWAEDVKFATDQILTFAEIEARTWNVAGDFRSFGELFRYRRDNINRLLPLLVANVVPIFSE